MRARGYFKAGYVEKYDSQAIEFPYDVRIEFSLNHHMTGLAE